MTELARLDALYAECALGTLAHDSNYRLPDEWYIDEPIHSGGNVVAAAMTFGKAGDLQRAKAIAELIAALHNAYPALRKQLREMAAASVEEERLHMQAAACMTACLQNTRESAKDRIGRDNPYWTQAYADVCTAVDREIDLRDRLAAVTAENVRFRNGFDNLLKAMEESPGLPLESLEEGDLSVWTDIISGVLMALGPYESTGKPITIFEALTDAARAASEGNEGKGRNG